MAIIFFDIDDTLYDQTQPFRAACYSMFGEGCPLDMDELYRARCRRSDESFKWKNEGKMTMEEMLIYRTQKAFEDMGVEMTREESLRFQELYAQNQDNIRMSREAVEMMEACVRAGALLGIITNGPSDHQRKKVKALELERWIPEENVIVSGDIGITKPDAGIFRYAEKKTGLADRERYFVGDHYKHDILGAAASGWKTVWLNRRGQQLPENGYHPDYVVCSDQEMCAAVQGIL